MPQTKEKIRVEVDAFYGKSYGKLGYCYEVESHYFFSRSGWRTPIGIDSAQIGLNNDIRTELDSLVKLGTGNPDDYEVHRKMQYFAGL